MINYLSLYLLIHLTRYINRDIVFINNELFSYSHMILTFK